MGKPLDVDITGEKSVAPSFTPPLAVAQIEVVSLLQDARLF